jgi:hypothetical protein
MYMPDFTAPHSILRLYRALSLDLYSSYILAAKKSLTINNNTFVAINLPGII